MAELVQYEFIQFPKRPVWHVENTYDENSKTLCGLTIPIGHASSTGAIQTHPDVCKMCNYMFDEYGRRDLMEEFEDFNPQWESTEDDDDLPI